MKKLLMIGFVCLALFTKSASAQVWYSGSDIGPDGTFFHYHDDGTTGGLNAEIDFANFETISTGTVDYAAIEIEGVDINNDQVTIAAIGAPTFTGGWVGSSSLYVYGLSSNDPSIVSGITAILYVQYTDPILGTYVVYAENDGYTAPTNYNHTN